MPQQIGFRSTIIYSLSDFNCELRNCNAKQVSHYNDDQSVINRDKSIALSREAFSSWVRGETLASQDKIAEVCSLGKSVR